MRSRMVRSLAAGLLLASTPLALANFHLMKVVEVFPGAAAAPDAQYVVIQMYTAGQNVVGGHEISVFDASNTLVQEFTFAASVGNGSNQAKILIATVEAQTFFSVNADLLMSPVLPSAGGKVCFDAIPLDCVAWGNYSGSSTGVGTPFRAATGLVQGEAAIRRLDIAGGATTLEAADDTDDSANDFIGGAPRPVNNAGVVGTPPPAICGNGALEGMEQCDDGNMDDGDGCSAMCLIEIPIFADGFEQ